jgi:hypothetical protein
VPEAKDVNDWAKVIAGLSVVALVWFVLPQFTGSTKTATVPAVAGWDDLILCSDLVSFDGKKTLSLDEDGTASLDDNSEAQRLTQKGEWELGNRPATYVIHFGDRSLHYERIAPEEWQSCMLVAGTSLSANLQLSWFAVEPEPPEQEPP